jgi:excisionase family DNA binding protein
MIQNNHQSEFIHSFISIGTAAKELHVSIKTIRRWDSQGLLHPIRNSLNQRLFDPKEIAQLNSSHFKSDISLPPTRYYTISEAAQKLGLSVKTIRRWDKAGKIVSSRNPYNQRVFSLQALNEAMNLQEMERQTPVALRPYNHQFPFTVSFSSSLTLTAIVVLIISTLIWSQHSIGSPTQFFNPSPYETLNSPQLSESTTPYPTSIPSFADEELPPLNSDVLTLASTTPNTHSVTAIQNRLTNVTIDAPPVAQNLSTTNTQSSDTKYNNMIDNTNIDNNIYVNITKGSTIKIIPYLASLIISPVYPPQSDVKISLINSSRLKNNPPTYLPDSLTEPKPIYLDINLGTPTSIDDFGNAVNLTTPSSPHDNSPITR